MLIYFGFQYARTPHMKTGKKPRNDVHLRRMVTGSGWIKRREGVGLVDMCELTPKRFQFSLH